MFENIVLVTSSMASFLALEELCAAQQSLTPKQSEAIFEASKHLQRIQSGAPNNSGKTFLWRKMVLNITKRSS